MTADLTARVTGALDAVTDPELDRSVVELGFARAAVDDDGRALVELRLPTFWCAANFAYLMAADARDAVAAVPGVRSVTVRLVDHFVADEVTA
ncbi:MAG: iron-sulfur cluster assembly protein, partial [Candidatus Dormibacteria bacterium]